MATVDVLGLLPLLTVAATGLVVLLAVAVRRHHGGVAALTWIGLAGALASLAAASSVVPSQITALFILDGYGLFYMALLIGASLAVAALAYGYLEEREDNPEEFYILLLSATLGALVLVMSRHFAALFLGLELLSVSLYALIAYQGTEEGALEAGLKYLILAAASSAFLLFGMALIYAELGTLEFDRMALGLVAQDEARHVFVLTGLALIVVGIGFKLAVAPFHLWTPDVYQGAPAPVTAFVATVSKGSVVALLLRFFFQAGVYPYDSVVVAFGLIAVASMFVGNLLALWQDNVKRLLAYSSIAHLGYLLVALVAGGPRAVEAATFYLVAYMVTTLGAFGVVTVVSEKDHDAEALEAYRGLFWRRPWLAVILTAALLSLAGIPLTAGFVGKFYVLAAGIESSLWLLVILLVINSAISVFYYLRLLVVIYSLLPEEEIRQVARTAPSFSRMGHLALAMLLVLLVWLGVYPTPLVHTIRLTVGSLW